ncbi:hypothetical protein [Pseudonocardia sp. NPDC046786]|uniref:hypothetical protein n=1 Tax=Pseudonocardia sp. NPDC046786 TaxID=3155471 RepID=UPI0033F6B1A1
MTYDAGSGPRAGLLGGETVRGLPAGVTLLGLLGDDGERLADAGATARSAPAEVHPLAGVRLLAPSRDPPRSGTVCASWTTCAAATGPSAGPPTCTRPGRRPPPSTSGTPPP